MKLGAALLVAVCSAVVVPAASAQVNVSFNDGSVTIAATGATVSEILAEWARVGGSTFVDAEKIPGNERLTLRIEDKPELDALEVLLRSVAGYMIAPDRNDPGAASSIARVFILPTSTPAAYTPPPVDAAPVAAFSDAPVAMTAAPPQPDDEGPVRVVIPEAPAQADGANGQASPLGQANPLTDGASTQTVPGLGVVTSTQPGVAIQTTPRSRRPAITPTQRPGGRGGGGGGGARR